MSPWTSSAIDSRGKSAQPHRSSRREMAPAPGNDAMGKVERKQARKAEWGRLLIYLSLTLRPFAWSPPMTWMLSKMTWLTRWRAKCNCYQWSRNFLKQQIVTLDEDAGSQTGIIDAISEIILIWMRKICDFDFMRGWSQRRHGCNTVALRGNQAVNRESKHQPAVSGETSLLDLRNIQASIIANSSLR